MKRVIFLLALVTGLNGCVSLTEVREFAGESASLASYKDLTTHFRDTYTREAPYLTESNQAAAQANDAKRQAAYADLLKVHDAVTLYMVTLGTLAGEKTFDLAPNIDAASSQIKTHAEFGLDAKHVDAIAAIVKLAVGRATAYYQQDAVKGMIRAGDSPLQTSLTGMSNLLRIYRKTHENERRQVLGLFETELALAKAHPKDPLLLALAKLHQEKKAAEFAAMDSKFNIAEKAVQHIAAGHTQLYRSVDNLSSAELKATLSSLNKDMKLLRKQLQALH